MVNNMMIDEAYSYAEKIIDTKEFKELLKLKKEIDTKYSNLIISFKTKEAYYLEALEYKDHYPNFDEVKRSFVEAKAKLYSKEEVSRYFVLEREINKMIKADLDEVKLSISDSLFNPIKKCSKH